MERRDRIAPSEKVNALVGKSQGTDQWSIDLGRCKRMRAWIHSWNVNYVERGKVK